MCAKEEVMNNILGKENLDASSEVQFSFGRNPYLRWEFIKEHKKVRKQEKTCFRPRKRSRRKEKKKENTLLNLKVIKKKRKRSRKKDENTQTYNWQT